MFVILHKCPSVTAISLTMQNSSSQQTVAWKSDQCMPVCHAIFIVSLKLQSYVDLFHVLVRFITIASRCVDEFGLMQAHPSVP